MSDFPGIGCHYPLSRKIRVYDPAPLYFCKRGGGGRGRSLFEIKEKKNRETVCCSSRPFTSPIWDMIICDSTKREKKRRKVFLCRRLLLWLSSLPLSPREVQVTSKIFLSFLFLSPCYSGNRIRFPLFFKKNPPRHPKYVVRLRTYVRMNTSIIIFDQITPFFP